MHPFFNGTKILDYLHKKDIPSGMSFLCGWGVLKKRRINGGSREEASIAECILLIKFVADDALATGENPPLPSVM